MALPVISNQKMNDYLKELGELAESTSLYGKPTTREMNVLMKSHPNTLCSVPMQEEGTFICNALALGIPAQVVMKWTGHSDYKAMKPYIDIADDIKANAMNKLYQL